MVKKAPATTHPHHRERNQNIFSALADSDDSSCYSSDTEKEAQPLAKPAEETVEQLRSRWAEGSASASAFTWNRVGGKSNYTIHQPLDVSVPQFRPETPEGSVADEPRSPTFYPMSDSTVIYSGYITPPQPSSTAPQTMAMRIKEALDTVERDRMARAQAPVKTYEERLTTIKQSLEKMTFRKCIE
jgi:hypothetical protein